MLDHHEVTMMLVSLGVLLGVARIFGECAQRLHQPVVVGEILAGILLGPTVFGTLAPEWSQALFPAEGDGAVVLSGLTNLAITLFLLVAGMDVDLSTVWRQGGAALRIGATGIAIPFAIGFCVAWLAPQLLGQKAGADSLIFALFFATAVSISALPVIVKILMDLKLYRTDFGMVVVAACVLNDLIGWMIFALILGLSGDSTADRMPIAVTAGLTIGFTAFMLTVGRWLFHRILPWLQAYTHWPGGVLGFAMTIALFGAAFTEWIGVHAILGSFMVGVAIGDSHHLREQTRMIIDQFVSFIFAPLFFASIGLRVNFVENFDLTIVLSVLATAMIGKFGSCLLGARWGGLGWKESRAVGFAMISVGAMGIIVGLLALDYGLIRQKLFVAIVIMALFTSMISGPMVQAMLGQRKSRTVANLLTSNTFIYRLEATNRAETIRELTKAACTRANVDAGIVERAVRLREEAMHTGLGHGVAVPHARIAGLSGPVAALGLSEAGIDFDAPDGEPANVIFLILTPENDDGAQLEIMAHIGHAFRIRETTDRLLRARNLTEVIAILRSEPAPTNS